MATITQVETARAARPLIISRRTLRQVFATCLITGIGLAVMVIFLMPIGYMLATAFKHDTQVTQTNAPLYPAAPATFTFEGKEYPLYDVPTADGVKRLALVKPFREDSDMVDPAHPELGVFNVKGRWRTWTPIYQFSLTFDNFVTAWEDVNFPRLFRNSFLIAAISTIGTLISCILVAYGFARFRFRGKSFLFIVLISTIVLPPQATIIPLYIMFTKLGWTGTWLPLLVPAFFANAYDVFLLRQYFMGIPRDLDEASELDGANPFQTLLHVIIPQSLPAITAVTLFHFFFVWNQYFEPLVYLLGKESLYPISVGVGAFVTTFTNYPGRSSAMAAVALLLPAVMFFFAQRQFMQGVVITGVEK